MEDKKSILSIRIKELRTELGLTQEELALKLGLKGKSSIANYESDKITPSDEVKLKMCEIFNCTIDYLMGKSDNKNNQIALNNYIKKQNRLIILKTMEKYAMQFVEADFDEADLDEFVNLLCLDRENSSPQEQGKKILNYLNKFDEKNRKKIKSLAIKIIEELVENETTMNNFHYLMSLVEKENMKNNQNLQTKYFMTPVYRPYFSRTT